MHPLFSPLGKLAGRAIYFNFFCKRVHETCKRLPNVYTNIADNNKTLMILSWFIVTITSQLVMAVAACI